VGPFDGRPGQCKVGHKNVKTPQLWHPPKRTPNPKLKIFFDSELLDLLNP